jgi:hypothetical protein
MTTIQWSRRRNVGNEVKYRGLIVIVVVVVAMHVEAVPELHQTLAESVSTLSLQL